MSTEDRYEPGKETSRTFRGDDILLVEIVLSVSTFWLFAQTASISAPRILQAFGLSETVLSAGVAAAGVVCGMLIAVAGSIADRNGHVWMVVAGNVVNIVGSLLLVLAPSGTLAALVFLAGRILQGAAAALIMSASLTMVRTFWEGRERQRAISMWSFGSFGASAFSSFLGGVLGQTVIGWRGIFLIGTVVSVVAIVLLRRAPETVTSRSGVAGLDWAGALTFASGTALLFILVTQFSTLNFNEAMPWIILAAIVGIFAVFAFIERRKGASAFLDFALFGNRQYTSVAVANFLFNTVGGGLIVSLWVLQLGYGLSSGTAGLLSLGFAAGVFTCLRIGEMMLGASGARVPMLLAVTLVAVAVAIQSMIFLGRPQYMVVNALGAVVLGAGLTIFATPATDAALSALPTDKSGVGSGFYKMASALGNGFGIAVSTAIFTWQRAGGSIADAIARAVPFAPDEDVVARQAGAVALGASVVFALLIAVWVPRRPVSSSDDAPAEAARGDLVH